MAKKKVVAKKKGKKKATAMKKVFEGTVPVPEDWQIEDNGRAIIVEIGDGEDNGMFIRIQSWDERNVPQEERHVDMRKFFGKRVRVTVEVIGDKNG